ncbi:hypothetical protein DH2020_004388 [Rehmannia glutinosa]|uniref:Uncharacterized protein n=1 Tax=Rehmannia glutinosa TaxID=99300 RepID=A0ABR0XPC8_REHGL
MFHHAEQFDLTPVSNDSSDSSKNIDLYGVESFNSGIGFFYAQEDNTYDDNYQHQQQLKEFGNFDDMYIDVVSPPFQSCEDEIKKIIGMKSQNTEPIEPKKSRSNIFPSASLEFLRKYRNRRLKPDNKISNEIQASHSPTLSTEIIIKLAAENFIQSTSRSSKEISTINHPYPSSILVRSEEDFQTVQLVQNLLSCAEKVADKQYDRSIKFLIACDEMSSCTGNPIQRLVFYFSEALSEKIANETGRIAPKYSERNFVDPLETVKSPNMILFAFQKDFPISQITKLVGIQAVLDHLGDAKKVHIIDLEIRSGVQWIILMQALTEKNYVQRLKITAVETKSSKSRVEDTGRQLASFARSLNLNFSFKIIAVEDILELEKDLFELETDEVVAVYAAYTLMSMIGKVDRLDHLMRMIKSVCPCVMIVVEFEANCNSPSFIGRFVESLFFFGAFFDSLADCFENDETSRRDAESMWLRLSIRNVLVAEGDERKIRHVNMNVWRTFFGRFGLVEIELSISSLDQANLVLQSLSCGRSCSLFRDDKCLTIGWKGTPITSISTWKFQ